MNKKWLFTKTYKTYKNYETKSSIPKVGAKPTLKQPL